MVKQRTSYQNASSEVNKICCFLTYFYLKLMYEKEFIEKCFFADTQLSRIIN